MPQLKEDEWPERNEPTTTEREAGAFKREGPPAKGADTGDSIEEMNEEAEEALLRHIRPGKSAESGTS